jgi:membrane fusion protein, multidrug efflux system
LKVDFRIPEMYLGKVRHGQTLIVRLDALPEHEREGVVYAISPLVDAGGRSILLRATVANSDRALRPGMFARIQILFSQDKALVIPEAALSPAGERQYVYRVRDGIAKRVEVRIGERRDGKVKVLSGLNVGDAVVVASLQRITDGAAVSVVAPGR